MRQIFIALAVVLILIILAGCTFTPIPQALDLQVTPTQGHPQGSGLKVTVTGSLNGDGKLDLGDGEVINVTGPKFVCDHVYSQAGAFTITLSQSDHIKTTQVKVINKPPWVGPPFTTQWGSFEYGELTHLDMRFRLSGCRNGMPQGAYGAYDPDGDSLKFIWHIVEENGKEESVFDPSGKRVDGAPTESTEVIWFPGMTGPPPIPLSVPQSTQTPSNVFRVTISVTAIDPWGGATVWQKEVTVAGKSCNQRS